MKILVAIPCYHCPDQISRVLNSLTSIHSIVDVIVIENAGKDTTLQAAIETSSSLMKNGLNIQIFRNEVNYGLGGSFKIAVQHARNSRYDYLFWLHGDDQAEVGDLQTMIETNQDESYDVIFGARFMKESRRVGYHRMRLWANLAFNYLASIILRRRIYEIGSGLNMYKVSSLPNSNILANWVNNVAFDLNLLRHYRNMKYIFFPIAWNQTDQKSTVSNMRVGLRVLTMLLIPRLGFLKKEEIVGESRRVFP